MLLLQDKIVQSANTIYNLFIIRINIAHVTKNQERALLLSNGILLSEEELYALESRYNDDMGFHYMRFLADTDPKELGPPKVEFKKKNDLP